MATPPQSYYTLGELVVQHDQCVRFGMDTTGIDHEIALVVEQMSLDDRIRGTISDRTTMNEARDILDARQRYFYDQDRIE